LKKTENIKVKFNDDLGEEEDFTSNKRRDSWLPDLKRASTLKHKLMGYKNESESI
jgi:hypothetical protein